MSGLKDCLEVENLQDQSLTMLQHHVSGSTQLQGVLNNHARNMTRFPRLLLALSALRTTPSSKLEKIYFEKTIGNTPMEKLLCDMFKN